MSHQKSLHKHVTGISREIDKFVKQTLICKDQSLLICNDSNKVYLLYNLNTSPFNYAQIFPTVEESITIRDNNQLYQKLSVLLTEKDQIALKKYIMKYSMK